MFKIYSLKQSTTLHKNNSLFMCEQGDDNMALSEHIDEFRQRLVFCLVLLLIFSLACFADVREIVKIFQAPATGVKFLQFSPGEYFFASFKIAAFCGILMSSPLFVYQIVLYLLPGLTKTERNIVVPLSLGSGALFFLGLLFSYFFLVPAALNFFILYGSEVVEPFWSLINILILLQFYFLQRDLPFKYPRFKLF